MWRKNINAFNLLGFRGKDDIKVIQENDHFNTALNVKEVDIWGQCFGEGKSVKSIQRCAGYFVHNWFFCFDLGPHPVVFGVLALHSGLGSRNHIE